MFSLTTTHLRFVCRATTPLRLEADTFRAGSNLRGALGQVMLRAYCAGDANDSQHAAHCPVHWLLAANLKPGEERRGYALVPPLANARADGLPPGDAFEFGLTLFGSAQQFLPYFILAVPEMGRMGIGPGRGKFELVRVWALNPLTGESEILFGDNGNVVRAPTVTVNHEMVMRHAECRIAGFSCASGAKNRNPMRNWEIGAAESVAIEFLTPMRLIDAQHTTKIPDFSTLFSRLLKRLDELEEQFAGGMGRALEEVRALQAYAARVEVREVNTRWVEVFSGSARRGMPSPLSGFVGRAVFSAPREVWMELLPWLLWGELAQVGKGAVKGNGVMRVVRE